MMIQTKPNSGRAVVELTRHLWRGGQYAHWWSLSQDGEKESHWFEVDKPEPPSLEWGERNQYFSVHSGSVKGSKNQRVTNDTVAAMNCLFGDFDAKDEVLPDEYAPHLPGDFDSLKPADQKTAIKAAQVEAMMLDLPKYKARAMARIRLCPLAPTWINDTGGGYQCFWFFADTVIVGDHNRERLKALQGAWAELIGADSGAKDLARVLRMPGSANVKPHFAPNYPIVTVVEREDSRLYSLADFEELTGIDDDWQKAQAAQATNTARPKQPTSDRVIDRFNSTVSIVDLLARNGYKIARTFKDTTRLVRPGGTSQSVTVWNHANRSFHHSSSDPLHGNDHGWDAYDVFKVLEHNGDYNAAFIAAKKAVGLWDADIGGAQAFAAMNGKTAYASTGEQARSNIPLSYTGPAFWRNRDHDEPVIITGSLPPIDGIAWYSILGSNAGLPGDELLLLGQEMPPTVPDVTPTTDTVDKAATANSGDGLPRIQVNNRQLNHVLSDALGAVVRRNSLTPAAPVICTRGGQLSRVLPSSKVVQSITQSALTGIFADVADWVSIKEVQRSEPKIVISNVYPPREVVSTFLGLGEWPALPELVGVISAPAYVGNGHWVQTTGYDAVSGLYLVDDVKIGDTTPTAQRVEWAKEQILIELLGDFPFKDEASRAHAVALTLLPFVRHHIPGATPLHLTEAPTQGTGKGLLTSACSFPALGEEIPSMTAGKDDDEWRKRLTALLQAGGSHANIDNITGKLESASLSAVLTQAIWEDRQLGATHMLRLPIRTIWTATANNVQMDQDIARRCVWIRLDANMERPQERTGFRHDDLLGWAKKHRGDLVTAAMILVNNWVERGEPLGDYTKGSFQAWAKTMGGILDAAGIPGFLANERELSDTAVSEGQAWKAFVEAWADAHHEQWVTVKDLFPIASHYDPPAPPQGLGLLDDLLGAGNERSRQSRLGRQFAQMADRVIGDWKITRGNAVKGYQQWRLARVS